MAKKIKSRRQLALMAGIAIARNKHARKAAMKAARSVMRHRQSRRAVLHTAKRRARHSRPLMIGAASVGAVSAAGAAAYSRTKRRSPEPE
jgi:endonuclease V-like protein UPF0215 family